MSKAMTRHHKEEALENPGPKMTGFWIVLGLAAVGAGIGAVRGTTGSKGAAALAAAEQGIGLATVGGTVVGFLSEGARNPAFATAGIGLVSIMVLGVAQYLTTPPTTATTTTTTTS